MLDLIEGVRMIQGAEPANFRTPHYHFYENNRVFTLER